MIRQKAYLRVHSLQINLEHHDGMFAPETKFETALRFSRFDLDHFLSSCAKEITLEDYSWPSAEHYVAAKLAGNRRLVTRVLEAKTGQEAYKLVKPWYRTKCRDWKNLRRVLMTRALYTLVQMYPEVKESLLDSGDQLIAETSQYDHYWGIGRDQRGENMLGVVWMDIRKKLREDQVNTL